MTNIKEVTTITGVEVIPQNEIDMAKFVETTKDMKAAFNCVSVAMHVTASEIEKFYSAWTRPLSKKNVWSRSRSHPGI